jgi:hypothetical protein
MSLVGGRMVQAHRYIWEQQRGPIPDNLVMDHRCRNRACINVEHLRLVTTKVNVTENIVGAAWQKNAAKTHCKYGHPFDDQNTRHHVSPNGKPARYCRACELARSRARRARKRLKDQHSQ